MIFSLEVSPEAQRELRAAVDWYEERDPELGRALYGEIASTLERIREAPRLHAKWLHDTRYRRARVHRFPFLVLFTFINEELIQVVAILHGRRNPDFLTKR